LEEEEPGVQIFKEGKVTAREGGGGGGDGKTSVHAVSNNTSGMVIVYLYLSTLCTAQRLSCLRIIFLGCVEDSANNYLH